MSKPDPVNQDGIPVKLPKPEIPDAPKEATTVNDDMTFNEAFAAARAEVGPSGFFEWHGRVFNPIYDGELSQLGKEEITSLYQNTMSQWSANHAGSNDEIAGTVPETELEPVIIIHDTAPVSHAVNDEMSFRDAFANARADVGPGGVFSWHGNEYSTYTSEEWNAMTVEEQNQFNQSFGDQEISQSSVSQNEIDIVSIDGAATFQSDDEVTSTENNSFESSSSPTGFSDGNLLEEDYVSDGQGGMLHIAIYEVNGQTVIRADSDGDGNFDTQLTPDGNGNLIMENEAGEQAIITQEEISQAQQAVDVDQEVSQTIYPQDVLPISDFNPDATDIEEWAE